MTSMVCAPDAIWGVEVLLCEGREQRDCQARQLSSRTLHPLRPLDVYISRVEDLLASGSTEIKA